MTCVECVLECVTCVNRKGRVGVSCNGCGFGRVVEFDDYVRPAAVGEFEELAMPVEYWIKGLAHFVIFECRFRKSDRATAASPRGARRPISQFCRVSKVTGKPCSWNTFTASAWVR